ncbi:hypothetical protein JCM10449v2_000441 [Rhodotorula kratochvilovae]
MRILSQSYSSLAAAASLAAVDQHDPSRPSPSSAATPVSRRPPRDQESHALDERNEVAAKQAPRHARPQLQTAESSLSFASLASAASTTSDLVMSASDPAPSPFFVPPPLERPPRPVVADKENVSSPVRERAASPFPRPDSPLPPVPRTSTTAAQRIRAPSRPPSTAASGFPTPLTAHNSLAAFKAAQAGAASNGGCSSSTHRTSSDVDLDLSFEYDPAQQADMSLLSDELVEEGLESHGDWVGIEVRPAEHDIPESQLVRSSSGQLVGARHARAASAMDLRAQFKAAAAAGGRADVAITMEHDDDAEARRHAIREGKRPLEGARAHPATAPLEQGERFLPEPLERAYRRNGGRGYAYNPTDALASEPRSAPPLFQATFADHQKRLPAAPVPAEEVKRSRAFPLPLRLLQQTKRSAEALAYSAASAFTRSPRSPAAADSDVDSMGASPMFDSDFDGTVRTAPSTPNDTPRMQECFDSDEATPPPPVPHRLGNSAHGAALAGLGLDFGAAVRDDDDEFPVVPLRQSRRVSLPPVAVRRRSIRHDKIPSLAISPPPLERPSEDSTTGTSSSTLSSQDSAADPTVSPVRRISRRLSTTSPTTTSRPLRPLVRFDHQTPVAVSSATDTPTSRASSPGGPSIPTPQHLLVSPSPHANVKRDPSFSFSPAPLRLVKVQLLRAAGYGAPAPEADIDAAVEQNALPAEPDAQPASPSTAVDMTTVAPARRRPGVWDDVADLLASPTAWADEVVPAKLTFVAGFLFLAPWLWLLGGWYLRPSDGEFHTQRGTRCRDAGCGCGRIVRGSALAAPAHAATASAAKQARLNPTEPARYAGLDRWVFMNRVAAGASGVIVAVLFAVAVSAAAAA